MQREKFDKILFDNGKLKGVRGLENTRVTDIEFQDDGSCFVHAKDGTGGEYADLACSIPG